jgi:hypothetical protein
LQALVDLAVRTGKLHRVFVWGSFVTNKPSPRDLDVLLIMDHDFEVNDVPSQIGLFSTPHGRDCSLRRMYSGRVFRSVTGAAAWLETYQISRDLRIRGCGTGAPVLQPGEQMLLAQQCVANLRRVLLEARKVHSPEDYVRLA